MSSDRFLPTCNKSPPTRQPTMAPSRDRLATHDPSYLIQSHYYTDVQPQSAMSTQLYFSFFEYRFTTVFLLGEKLCSRIC
jgi:hypothetical protein